MDFAHWQEKGTNSSINKNELAIQGHKAAIREKKRLKTFAEMSKITAKRRDGP